MSNLFVSVVALTSVNTRLENRDFERVPGIPPYMKDGIWAERAVAYGGVPNYTKTAALNAVVVP